MADSAWVPALLTLGGVFVAQAVILYAAKKSRASAAELERTARKAEANLFWNRERRVAYAAYVRLNTELISLALARHGGLNQDAEIAEAKRLVNASMGEISLLAGPAVEKLAIEPVRPRLSWRGR